ncbi:MAG: DMT family transporter [Alphaproteobacteria bacterium]|nr:DMT family transporter [Alphaproteobacteria bacterium]
MTVSLPPGRDTHVVAAGDRPLLGVGLLLVAYTIIPGLDAIAKHLAATYPVLEVVWARFFFHFLLLAPFALWRYGWRGLWPPNPVLQVIRGGFLLGATICFFAALKTLPIADTLGIFFVSPMVVTLLSALLLKETVGIRRWTTVAIGFVGVCIIIRPGAGVFEEGAVFALGAGLCYALYAIATRRLSRTAPPLVTLTYTALLGAIVMSAVMPFEWVTPRGGDIGWMVLLGATAASGHFFIIKAYEQAPASFLAPYGYAEIVSAAVIGYLVFGNFPDGWTWVGIFILIASGIYLSIRERKVRGRLRVRA